ncbi:hypothetical protein [Vibrio taketomensis]|uniref:hypothetical protein n=1 Tax=Vibrio taketomensis TaxID=2572923 RepID=UPI001E39184D|nr:hypothetical protein [Vibrio taketomensis]
MLTLERNHDFQVFVSPKNHQVSSVNPPRFTWPEQNGEKNYTFVLEHTTFNHRWLYENTSSPVQIPQILPNGDYRWYVSDSNGLRSQWHHFSINQTSQAYLPPSAKELFELCSNREQFMMYFDEDIQEVKQESWLVYENSNALLRLPISMQFNTQIIIEEVKKKANALLLLMCAVGLTEI